MWNGRFELGDNQLLAMRLGPGGATPLWNVSLGDDNTAAQFPIVDSPSGPRVVAAMWHGGPMFIGTGSSLSCQN